MHSCCKLKYKKWDWDAKKLRKNWQEMSGTKFEDVTLDGKDFKAKGTTYGSLETGVDTFKAPLIEKPKGFIFY